jgi:hypothetical protein
VTLPALIAAKRLDVLVRVRQVPEARDSPTVVEGPEVSLQISKYPSRRFHHDLERDERGYLISPLEDGERFEPPKLDLGQGLEEPTDFRLAPPKDCGEVQRRTLCSAGETLDIFKFLARVLTQIPEPNQTTLLPRPASVTKWNFLSFHARFRRRRSRGRFRMRHSKMKRDRS